MKDDMANSISVELELLIKKVAQETAESLRGVIENHYERLKKEFWKNNSNLSIRQAEIADLICAGCTSKDISSVLNISPACVNFHRNNLRKLLKIPRNKNLRAYLLSLPLNS